METKKAFARGRTWKTT